MQLHFSKRSLADHIFRSLKLAENSPDTDQRSGGHRRPCDPVLCIALQGVALRTPSSSTRSSIVLPSSTWTESWFATVHFTHKSLASRYSISGPVWKPSGKTLQVIDSFFHARFLNQDGARRNRDSASRNSVQCINCYQHTPTNRYMSMRIICQDTLPQGSQVRYTKIMIFGCVAGLLLVDSKYGGRRCQLLVVGS